MTSRVEELKNNPKLKSFIKKYKLDDKTLEDSYLVIKRFIEQFIKCNKPGPLEECKQLIKGIQLKLEYKNKQLYTVSENCVHWKYENTDYKIKENILFTEYDKFKITKKISDYVSLNPEEYNPSINIFITAVQKIFVSDKSNVKGIYLYGEPGVGKTYMMKLIANSFANNDQKVVVVTMNRLIKVVKETFNNYINNDYNKFLDLCTNVDVLILDDIGSEPVTEWSRDELLFGLLNTRLENNKLTFFTSNLSLDDLKKYYTSTKNSSNNLTQKIKSTRAKRIVERIKGLCDDILVVGKNQRS
ncbi:primosomal protein DnaI [Spiroplasma gladiatoris]|uniref:Primosomal protein DnaI n=1 Tax=Spiroplasma gladiatoris TaxID=2143 RepID=A0A4P7AIN2_9MOLU|nr:DnaA/Hda family protein [Spiroplasma gladiatoris]QBQ08041.1 primosomal protein DnaI [Spiroplasma gladiatoris]